MKLVAGLLLSLGLVFQAGSSCSSAVQPAPTSMSMDCSGMDESDPPMQDSDGKDMATACHACVSRIAELPAVPRSLVWKDLVPGVELQNAIRGTALKPPTPPPRRQDLLNLST